MKDNNRIEANVFDLFITNRCTMNCKMCCAYVPHVKNAHHSDKDVVFREMKGFFEVFDYANRIEILGGEPLMHPDLLAIVKEATKYKEQFGDIRITTNCTIVPGDELLAYIKNCGVLFDFVLDDYGEISRHCRQVQDKIKEYNIPFRVDRYYGDEQEQYYSGWIDFGNNKCKNYSDDELLNVFNNCTAAKKNSFYATYDGQVHQCLYSLAGQYTGRLEPKPGEWIDLFDETLTREQKRSIASSFLKRPYNACRHCNGFLSETAKRFPAAIQAPKD